jgi:hypothetical protein
VEAAQVGGLKSWTRDRFRWCFDIDRMARFGLRKGRGWAAAQAYLSSSRI